MEYKLTRDFTPIAELSGMFYARPGDKVEIAVGDAAEYSGFILRGGNPLQFSAKNIKARAIGNKATLTVTPNNGSDGGGGGGGDYIATDEEVDDMLDDIFGEDDTTEATTGGGTDTSGD